MVGKFLSKQSLEAKPSKFLELDTIVAVIDITVVIGAFSGEDLK